MEKRFCDRCGVELPARRVMRLTIRPTDEKELDRYLDFCEQCTKPILDLLKPLPLQVGG